MIISNFLLSWDDNRYLIFMYFFEVPNVYRNMKKGSMFPPQFL